MTASTSCPVDDPRRLPLRMVTVLGFGRASNTVRTLYHSIDITSHPPCALSSTDWHWPPPPAGRADRRHAACAGAHLGSTIRSIVPPTSQATRFPPERVRKSSPQMD